MLGDDSTLPPGLWKKKNERIIIISMEKRTSKIRGVIYDCDGVILDSLEANRWFYSSFCAALGREPLTEEELRYAHSHTAREAIHHIFRVAPEKERLALERLARMDPQVSVSRLKLEPRILPALEALKARGVRLAISTSRTTTMGYILKKFGLDSFFELVVTSQDVQNPKPHPESIEKILRHFSLEKDEVFFVGDSETDRRAALAAGVKFIAYKNEQIPAFASIQDHLAILHFL
jgi:phosphoglycolate phosphatase